MENIGTFNKQAFMPVIMTDQVKLPSNKRFYEFDTVSVEDMTAIDEQYLVSLKHLSSGKNIENLLKRKVKDSFFKHNGGEFDINNLMQCDIDAILFHLRITAYGPEVEVEVIDPFTDKKIKQTIDINKIQFLDAEIESDVNGFYSFTLPKQKDVITYRILNKKETDDLDEKIEKRRKTLKNTDDLFELIEEVIGRVIMIESVKSNQTTNDPVIIREYITKSNPSDIADLRLNMLSAEPKYKLEYEFQSENGEFFRSKFRLGPKFFYPRF